MMKKLDYQYKISIMDIRKFPKRRSALRPEVPVLLGASDNELKFIKAMGIEHLSLVLKRDELEGDAFHKGMEKFRKNGFIVTNAACMELQKNRAIHLGLENRDEEIEAFIDAMKLFSSEGIEFTSVAWQPYGILRTDKRIGKHTRGQRALYCDECEILKRGMREEREYDEDEIWANFTYFANAVVPELERYKVKMAIHPNDPPIEKAEGIASLFYSTSSFRRILKECNDSKAVGMKMCIGCYLEAGDAYGDLLSDIDEFGKEGRILCVHFRNVSSTLPVFEEVLIEDGYANMYTIMKALVASGTDAVISIDHAADAVEGYGGLIGSFAYPTGYMKGLLSAAENEICG